MEKREECLRLYDANKSKSFPEVEDISCDDLLDLLQNNPSSVLLLDCRHEDEQAVSTIPGSIQLQAVNMKEFEKQFAPLPENIVCFCTIGVRSGFVCKHILDEHPSLQGRVRNLAGSIVAYCHSLERASGKLSEKSCRVGLVSGNDGMTETHRVHVYGATWDLCPPNYDTVTFSFAKQAWVAVKWAVGWGT